MGSDVYIQSALNMADVEERSQGQWRIFSKLGAGISDASGKWEITLNAAACLPTLRSGEAMPDTGLAGSQSW